MAADAKLEELSVSFDSTDGQSIISGRLWLPKHEKLQVKATPETRRSSLVEPRALVVIAHGMAEHSGRYEYFARKLAEKGFVMAAHDHVGHGKSCEAEDLGCMKAPFGSEVLVEDLHIMRNIAASYCPKETPCFMFGHSMGSYIVRNYLLKHAAGLTGAIICGSGQVARPLALLAPKLCAVVQRSKGPNAKSAFLDSLFLGPFSKAFKHEKDPLAWLSCDLKNREAYRADPLCGFPFSAAAYGALAQLAQHACDPDLAISLPQDLPLLFISGSDDPVGDFGKGVTKASEMYKAAGVKQVQLTIYQGLRHEILNETTRDVVISDIYQWLCAHC